MSMKVVLTCPRILFSKLTLMLIDVPPQADTVSSSGYFDPLAQDQDHSK